MSSASESITTRLCLDRLRSAKKTREGYVGPWLPEPIVEGTSLSPELRLEMANEVSVAFLAVLERLTPEERAAFLLHEVFDYDYREIARILGKAEPACRQLVHRACAHLLAGRPRFAMAAEARERLLEKFIVAAGSGDRQAVMELLSEDARYVADGGGKVIAALAGKESMMLTVEFAPGFADQPHRHDAHVFVYVLEGKVEFQVKGSPARSSRPSAQDLGDGQG